MRVHYHLGKENVVVDSLSRLLMSSVSHVEEKTSEGCSQTYFLASSHDEHFRQWCNN